MLKDYSDYYECQSYRDVVNRTQLYLDSVSV